MYLLVVVKSRTCITMSIVTNAAKKTLRIKRGASACRWETKFS